MFLQVGLAVGDIDSVSRNATLKRLAMQVSYVAEIEETYPRCLRRRWYKPHVVETPNRSSCGTRSGALMRLGLVG